MTGMSPSSKKEVPQNSYKYFVTKQIYAHYKDVTIND